MENTWLSRWLFLPSGTQGAVCEGNKRCCVARRRSAPAVGKDRQGSLAAASVAQFGKPAAFPGGVGLAHPCAAQALASHFDLEHKQVRWPKVMQAGFVFPRCSVSKWSAWIIHFSSACCSIEFPVSGHPASTRWRIHCCVCLAGTPRCVGSGKWGQGGRPPHPGVL